LALAIQALAVAVTTDGFGTPLVQRPSITAMHKQAAAAAAWISGALLTALTFALGPVLAAPMFGHEVGRLVQLASPMFLLASIAVVPTALARRRMAFAKVAAVEVAGIVGGAITSIVLAVAGLDAPAVVLGTVANVATASLVMIVSEPWVMPRLRLAALREVGGFGSIAAASSLMNIAYRNVDYLIVGSQLSAAQVGYYFRAYQLGVDYQAKVSGILLRVALPVYSRANADQVRQLRLRMTRVHALIIFPILGAFIVVAPIGLPALLGEAWRPSVVPAQILALAGMVLALLTGLGPLMMALGRVRSLFVFTCVRLVAHAIAIGIASQIGLTAVCIAVVIVQTLALLWAQIAMIGPALGLPLRSLWDESGAALAGTAVAVLSGYAIRSGLTSVGAPALATLAACLAGCAAAYLLTIRAAFTASWRDGAILARRLAGRREPASA
jgi:PST family polysaccharide transporter